MARILCIVLGSIGAALACAGPAEAAPPGPQYTGAAEPGESTARVAGYSTTLPPAEKCWFEYGETPAYGQRVDVVCAGTTYGTLTGLRPGTLYHYRYAGANADGTTYGVDKSFTTLGAAPPPPPGGPGPTPPSIGATIARARTPAAVARRGLLVRAQVSASCPCTLRVSLRVSRSTARLLGVRSKILGRATGTTAAGATTVRVRVGSRARRALRRARSVPVTVDVRVADRDRREDAVSQSLRLRRPA